MSQPQCNWLCAEQVAAENSIRPKLSDKDKLRGLRSILENYKSYEHVKFTQAQVDAISDCIQELEKRC